MRRTTRITISALAASVSILSARAGFCAEPPRQSQRASASDFDALLKADAPIVLCIDDKPTTGGQPSENAYAKAAANGFRAVLTLRSRRDGVDSLRERFMAEQNHLRYFNLPVLAALPGHEQVDEFLRLLRDKRNQPMLVNCAFAERVAPYMLIFRMVEQGWSEEKAIEEAARSGLKAGQLRIFAREYSSRNKANKH
jgi:protein tyrosine phosphatase (PTP) superfamily phosphohydrolase (DUF442 family)